MSDQPRPVNRRDRRRREQRRLLIAVASFLVIVGGAVIALAYGSRAVALGATCLLAGAGILSLLWALLALVERWME